MSDVKSTAVVGPGDRGVAITFGLCILAALADGYDLQATGITAIRFANELGITTRGLSWIFAANSLGLFIGASFGGWLADRVGRRPVMIFSMFTFGIFSILTGMVTSGAFLAEIRLMTGIGLGAALANIIALVAERSPPDRRSARVMLITATHPLGGAIPGTIMTLFPVVDWRLIFHVGGWWPLALAALILFLAGAVAIELLRPKPSRPWPIWPSPRACARRIAPAYCGPAPARRHAPAAF